MLAGEQGRCAHLVVLRTDWPVGRTWPLDAWPQAGDGSLERATAALICMRRLDTDSQINS